GVQCPICLEFGLIKHHHNWICSQNHKTREAHLIAMDDYFYIFGMNITNKECRRFLHIECKHIAKRLLKQMNLEEKGKNKNRVYVKVLTTK
ncbi:MAG: NERD domain-containing protein, partial [Paenisporosarcina sp.]